MNEASSVPGDVSAEARAFTGVWQRLSIATLDFWCVAGGFRVFRACAVEGRPTSGGSGRRSRAAAWPLDHAG